MVRTTKANKEAEVGNISLRRLFLLCECWAEELANCENLKKYTTAAGCVGCGVHGVGLSLKFWFVEHSVGVLHRYAHPCGTHRYIPHPRFQPTLTGTLTNVSIKAIGCRNARKIPDDCYGRPGKWGIIIRRWLSCYERKMIELSTDSRHALIQELISVFWVASENNKWEIMNINTWTI